MKRLLYLLLICSFANGTNLDSLALKYGTDKSSAFHNYTTIYEKYLGPLQHKNINFLEIGFAGGYSAHMWDEYFSNQQSKLYFIDINPDCFKYINDLTTRCTLNLVNQANAVELTQWLKLVGDEFDIIIDDGSHQMEHQITTFKTLFPRLKKGGIYIIEDLHTSYWRDYGSDGDCQNPQASPASAIRYLQNLVDDLNFTGARTENGNRSKNVQLVEHLNIYQESISSIHFYCSLCFIFKD